MDVVTLAIAIGLVVSLLFTEVFGLSGGGMIVPGYLALYMKQPSSILLTLLVAFVTFGVVKAISQVAIVYGRRRIVLMVLFGFLIGSVVRYLLGSGPTNPDTMSSGCICVVGFIVPGLIALWMDRQGIVETLGPLATSSIVVRLVIVVIGLESLL